MIFTKKEQTLVLAMIARELSHTEETDSCLVDYKLALRELMHKIATASEA